MKLFFSTLISLLMLIGLFTSIDQVEANAGMVDDPVQYEDGCTRIGQCINNRTCVPEISQDGYRVVRLGNDENCGSSTIGGVDAPAGIRGKNVLANQQNSESSIGIVIFLSNLLRVFAIVAGIWAMFNFISAGFIYITSMSDTGATQRVASKITMTVVGLSIIAGAYTLAALVGWIMFGDPGFILNPQLQGALQ